MYNTFNMHNMYNTNKKNKKKSIKYKLPSTVEHKVIFHTLSIVQVIILTFSLNLLNWFDDGL